jgi:hypothetical protein
MSDPIVTLTNAARDYCFHAERLTEMRRAAARSCENEDGPEFPKCHNRRVDDRDAWSPNLPMDQWCARCREYEENRTRYRAHRKLKADAERRMRYAWRRIGKVKP